MPPQHPQNTHTIKHKHRPCIDAVYKTCTTAHRSPYAVHVPNTPRSHPPSSTSIAHGIMQYVRVFTICVPSIVSHDCVRLKTSGRLHTPRDYAICIPTINKVLRFQQPPCMTHCQLFCPTPALHTKACTVAPSRTTNKSMVMASARTMSFIQFSTSVRHAV